MATSMQHKRMKSYENITRDFLPKTNYMVIRLDGKAFHTYTKRFIKPFDDRIEKAFRETALYLAEQIQSTKLVYSQSDEITLICGIKSIENGQHWFNGNIQKITSTSASLASSKFNLEMMKLYPGLFNDGDEILATFDSRVFFVPASDYQLPSDKGMYGPFFGKDGLEDRNVFDNSETEKLAYAEVIEWRQQDAIRNSVQMLAQSEFSHKELQNKSVNELKSMLEKVNNSWDDLPLARKHGFMVVKSQWAKIIKNGPLAGQTVMRNVFEIDENMPNIKFNTKYITDKL